MRTRSARYYRKNPLTNSELLIGGGVAIALTGIGIYFLATRNTLPAAPASAISPPVLPGGTPGQSGISSLTQGPDYGPGGYVQPAPVAGV
jgi:hypothetical protein